uniref:RING-type domain-containing protein n=1 Tax=Anopheles minimus TaxID=112268 RepID=A0A182WI84_9DIPT
MSATRWIHCNICFHLLSRKERKFYHLSCRHVLCKQCMAKTNRGTICPVCEKPLERFTELNNQMDRKEKMFYDSSSLKVLSVAYQSVIFQHKQRENMIRGILRCRTAILQMKEMEDSLRQKIVETQRRYEKFRTYRRNLQETLRQMSPRYGGGPLMGPVSGRNHTSALSNRDSDTASRRNERNRPVSKMSPNVDSFETPSLTTNRPPSIMDGSFTRQHVPPV